jgi:hypothetical protein
MRKGRKGEWRRGAGKNGKGDNPVIEMSETPAETY